MKFVYSLIILLFVLNPAVYCRQPVHLRFVPMYHSSPLVLEDKWYKTGGDSVMFETLRCYISGVSLYKDGRVVYREDDSYHLLDYADNASMSWIMDVPEKITYDAIGFNLGIDSTTNVSGVQGGALDPSNGMYWAWQSGYINFKLEGRSNLCPTRKNIFQFHLGGYMLQDYAMQRVLLNTRDTDIAIALPVDKLMAAIDLSTLHAIMIPCIEAVNMAKLIAKQFEVLSR